MNKYDILHKNTKTTLKFNPKYSYIVKKFFQVVNKTKIISNCEIH